MSVSSKVVTDAEMETPEAEEEDEGAHNEEAEPEVSLEEVVDADVDAETPDAEGELAEVADEDADEAALKRC